MKNKVLIFGEFGQVAKELIKEFQKEDFEVFPLSSKKFNFSDIKTLEKSILEVNPRIVINAAAFNDVEGAESEIEACRKANAFGPKNISIICNKFDLPFIHISTDYVFGDQKKEKPIEENAFKNPKGVYAQSKFEGECFINNKKRIILRVSWVFSLTGKNFLTTMLNLLDENEIRVVNDQISSPTSAIGIATCILEISKKIISKNEFNKWGTYHFSGYPYCSWFDFAEEIFNLLYLKKITKDKMKVSKISSKEYLSRVERPLYSALDCKQIYKNFGIPMDDWKFQLSNYLDQLYEK